jgi:hypothetical protein
VLVRIESASSEPGNCSCIAGSYCVPADLEERTFAEKSTAQNTVVESRDFLVLVRA